MLLKKGFVAAALSAVCLSAGASGDIVIGQAAPLTGSLASTGKEMVLGAKVYFDLINAKGGVNGQKIRHVVKDDAYVIDETIRVTKELIEKDRAVALIGYAGTGNVGELLKQGVLAATNTPLIAPYTGGEPLRSPYNGHNFHIRAGYADETEKMVDQFVGNGLKKVGVFYQNDPFGKAGLAGVEKALAKHGLKIVGEGTYEKGKEDVASAVDALGKASPQAIIMIGIMRPAAAFVKAYRQRDPGAQIFSISVINGPALFQLAGDKAARGVGITQVMPSPNNVALNISKEYLKAMATYAPDVKPSYTSFEEYIGAKVLVEGLKRVKGEYTGASVTAALEGVDTDVGGLRIKFGEKNRIGSRYVDVTYLKANGELGM